MHSIKDIVKQLIGKSLDAYNTKYTKVLNTRIDNIVAQAGNDNTEIVDARIDSAGVTHTTLNNRILAETKMNDEQLVEYTGINISAEDTTQGYLKDVEILGNTIQNEEVLADIKSVGELQEDGTYKMSILSCGKNLINNSKVEKGFYVQENNSNVISNNGFTTSNYIKIKPNTKYVLNKLISYKAFYDRNKNIIPVNPTYDVNTFTTPTNASYVRISVSNANDITTYQLEEGTVTTPYEPYQENKCDILLPCQLEKVGDVADRLYYDDVEKAWCIEKNVETIILNGSETWLKYPKWDTINTMAFYLDYDAYKVYNKHVAKKEYTECKSNLFNYSPRTDFVNLADKEKIIMYGAHTGADINITTCSPQISILKSKLPTQDVTGFKTWLSQNPTLVKYQLATPQKIVLPLSTQIALNSFFGTTHVYMKSGEVEGTIKCKIPKSIGATVQSLNNKTDILSDRIEAIEGLKDSQNMKYETDKGYLVCKETKNGVIDDLKIEGKTLVNRFIFDRGSSDVDKVEIVCKDYKALSYGKFTIPNLSDKNIGINIYNKDTDSFIRSISIRPNSSVVVDLDKENAYLFNVYGYKNVGWTDYEALKTITMFLEGDHTQNPPSYFEGLMSVGQDVDEIEVLSVKNDGNLVEYIELNGVIVANGKDYTDNKYVRTNYIIVEPNQTYYIKLPTNVLYKGCTVYFYDSNKSYLGHKSGLTSEFTTVANTKFIRIDMKKSDDTSNTQEDINNCDFVVSKYRVSEYIPYQSDKKQILFYNENGELEPIQELHEWDSIEKHSDNKWYYHKRSGKVVLNGSENWTNYDSLGACTPYLVAIPKINYNHAPISDKFVGSIFDGRDEEKICVGGSPHIIIQKANSTLSTQDVAGFKQWLQANNVTVVYQLAQEEVYELAPLHLDSYANETLILCNSGAISPKMEFSITSHINELIKSQGERINLLEEKVYQYMVTQNRMQLSSTYSTDSVTFKVDYFSLCGDEENYDEDLYNLILNNILVGKDNYNYDKMFTMILDYASWNQISWEQFDILVGLMDMQHNPPVEEGITEDESMEETPVE